MMISNLPVELQNKIFFYCAEHPCAKIMKIYYRRDFRDFKEFKDKGFTRAIELRRSFRGGDCKICEKRGRKLYEYETEIFLCKSCVVSATTDYYRRLYHSRDYVFSEYEFQDMYKRMERRDESIYNALP